MITAADLRSKRTILSVSSILESEDNQTWTGFSIPPRRWTKVAELAMATAAPVMAGVTSRLSARER